MTQSVTGPSLQCVGILNGKGTFNVPVMSEDDDDADDDKGLAQLRVVHMQIFPVSCVWIKVMVNQVQV